MSAAQWEFEAEETSSGPMFSVYDECGIRISDPYIREYQARLIAAAPTLLAALHDVMRAVPCVLRDEGLLVQVDAAIALARSPSMERAHD